MILVFVETDLEGSAMEVSLEAVTFARDLSAAGNGVPVDAVVVGAVSDALRQELAAYGVRTVHQVGGAAVEAFSGAGWASAILTVFEASRLDRDDGGRDRPRQRADGPRRRPRRGPHGRQRAVVLRPGALRRHPPGRRRLPRMEEMKLHQRPAVFTLAGHAVEAQPAVARRGR